MKKIVAILLVLFVLGGPVAEAKSFWWWYLQRVRENNNQQEEVRDGDDDDDNDERGHEPIWDEAGRTVVKTIEHDDRERSYRLHLPEDYDDRDDYPLVVVLHGGGDDARTVELDSGFSRLADDEDFIVVYPESRGAVGTWNAGFCCGAAQKKNIDDVDFIDSVIDEIEDDYEVDDDEIFVVGISNGGSMAYRAAAELAGRVKGVAVIAASIGDYRRPRDEVSAIIFHGLEDNNVPFEGGVGWKSVSRVENNPVEDAVNFWVRTNDCSRKYDKEYLGNGVTSYEYDRCDAGSEVLLYVMENAEHEWPKEWSGGIDATKEIWDFFEDL